MTDDDLCPMSDEVFSVSPDRRIFMRLGREGAANCPQCARLVRVFQPKGWTTSWIYRQHNRTPAPPRTTERKTYGIFRRWGP